ncbi:L-lactate dehydrogenase (quinone) large subunit LdhH [Desulforhopalus sp. IMCC35007]|uniref:L-lactate dehydrogenase (quinone) large subunit LdhH n=1 Tax=Desulforhopalus sp. IMCC35007 TaxID=2569543 RepID=UPI0010ADFD52|nr:LUD domain-containing protein [Desulforhopalus sp. IMCC35007]TKB09956.1 4Fe-4S dicluster domain-containing protein [Desulforhopalus sp. IMCC35007]
MMKTNTNYKESVEQAIANPKLSKALHLFGDAYLIARENAYRGLDFEQMRTELSDIKEEVRLNRKELLAEFIKNAEAAGSKVFLAKNTKEANDYVIKLAKSKDAKLIAKSKSMVSEEAHFNKAVQAHGIRAAETDLGEWIIQLAGQRPSHMVMPAIHMFKEEVAELFSKEAGKTLTPEIKTLVDHARTRLRQEYFDADIGLTGANFLVANTGGIGLVTNEGNARLCATLPKVHVVFASIHKLVRNIEDAIKITRLLPRNATGQLLTSYVTWIKGCVPCDGEQKEQHIVLIDGGREALYESKACRDALKCIQCGACANVCPVYQTVGGHVFGSIYISAIGVILTAFYEGLDKAKDITRACIGCRSCVAVCPSKIDLEEIILHLRNEVTKEYGMGVIKNVAFKAVMKNRGLFHSMVRAASKLQRPVTHKNRKEGEPRIIRHLPLHFLDRDFTEWRDLPSIAPKSFRDQFDTIPQTLFNPDYKVGFFVGCGADFVYPEVGVSLIKVLNSLNVEVVFPKGQNCCGIPALYSGDTETGLDLAKQSVEAFTEAEVDYVLSICPTCTMAVKRDFVDRLADHPQWAAKARELSAKTMDASAFLENVLGASQKLASTTTDQSVTYHDSCHLKRGSNVYKEPRALLKSTGITVKEMKNSDRCCGFGGTYSFLSHPQISKQITADKVSAIEATGVKTVAMDCPGCMIMLKGAVGKANESIRCVHTIELLAEAIDNNKK